MMDFLSYDIHFAKYCDMVNIEIINKEEYVPVVILSSVNKYQYNISQNFKDKIGETKVAKAQELLELQ